MSPHSLRALNTPPMTSKKAMTAIRAPEPSAPSTRKGDSSHFQKGNPPSTFRKPAWVSMMVWPASSTVRAYSPPGIRKVRA